MLQISKESRRKILLEMDPVELVKSCSSNMEMSRECERLGVFEDKLSQLMPLAQPVYTAKDQLRLATIGMRTYYNGRILQNADGSIDITEVKFGTGHSPAIIHGYHHVCHFTLRGLPPKTGTKVWILGFPQETGEGINVNKISVFKDLASCVSFIESLRGDERDDERGPFYSLIDSARNTALYNNTPVEKWKEVLLKFVKRELRGEMPDGNDLLDILISQEVTLP